MKTYSLTLAVFGIANILTVSVYADDLSVGQQIYRQQCADCHGERGEGVSGAYEQQLIGDRPVAELAELISKTMPEGSPKDCVGAEATEVAKYIYEEFYSPAAQMRNEPPRIAFSRLTVRQYENSVADLIAQFTGRGTWNEKLGLHGEYFADARFRRDKRKIDRTDDVVDFQFGDGTPFEANEKDDNAKTDDQKKDKETEFSAKWSGAVLARETGDYEFIVHTENGMKLWVNDNETPLIDAWVKSGNDTEYRGTIRLLGGRAYPLRLEWFKSKRGETASVSLHWKPPHQTEEVIPKRNLSPNWFPETFVLTTPFPPDDSSIGYERGNSISKAWDQAKTNAAIEVAGYVMRNLDRFAKTKADAKDRSQKLKDFATRFVESAFRRPLTDELRKIVIDRQFEETNDDATAVKRVVLLTLLSPRFLYREYGWGEFDSYATASWLSFGLWDSIPDDQLLSAAAKGQLQTRQQIASQARRMVNDIRTKAKLAEFFRQWLGVNRFHDVGKDDKHFPDFDEIILSDLRTSLELSVEDVAWNGNSDFRQLLKTDQVFLNGRLAKFYGVDLPADAPFQKVSFEPEKRSGVLTHPFMLTGLAYYTESSPIHRGVFLSRSVLGRFLKPPPIAVSPLAPDLHPDLTTRERTKMQTSPAQCQSCHVMINSLGFSLEHFDAVGRYREEEKQQPIDASGSYRTTSGEIVQFNGARELGDFLANSQEVQAAFTEQLFNYFNKQPVQAFGAGQMEHLRKSFVDQEFSIREALVESVTSSVLTARESTTTAAND